MIYLWDEEGKYFFKLVGDKLEKDVNLDASSFYGPFRFGVVSADDPRMKEGFKILEYPIVWGHDEDSTLKLRKAIPGMFYSILKIKWKK